MPPSSPTRRSTGLAAPGLCCPASRRRSAEREGKTVTRRCPQGGRPAVRALALAAAAAALPLLAGCADDFPELTYAERYCYRTLAEVDCHRRPLPDRKSTRLNSSHECA